MRRICRLSWFLIVFVIVGCGAKTSENLVVIPARMLAIVGTPSVGDGRVRFREVFCSVLALRHGPQENPQCQDYLWRLADEKDGAVAPARLPPHDPRLRIVLVAGAFSECLSEAGQLYRSGVQRLQSLGYRIDTVHISGRSGSDTDARLIAEALGQIPVEADERLLMLGHSKGAVDILHFLVNYPEQAARVSAVLSVAGAVNGSPLADMTAPLYVLFGAYLPFVRCGPGDHQVIADLEPTVRLHWLATHRLPAHVRYFSLAAFAERARVARALFLTSGWLARLDPQNDGQLLARDMLIPGSTLLGYARADHWAVALTLENKFPFLAGRPGVQNKFPADVLFEAMVLFVIEHLQGHVSGQ
jgi:hypothetical protein